MAMVSTSRYPQTSSVNSFPTSNEIMGDKCGFPFRLLVDTRLSAYI